MEWLKRMGLQQAFFCLTLIFLLAGTILSGLVFWGCIALRAEEGTNLTIEMREHALEEKLGVGDFQSQYSEGEVVSEYIHAVDLLQVLLPVLFILAALLAADVVFFKLKLKRPLNVLKAGADRIMRNDLDFSIEYRGEDELGQLCEAFERMRSALRENNQELWRQAEERRRLNAAFSHDLRNPVTVVKGSAKLLSKRLEGGLLDPQSAGEGIELIQEYANRIEAYVEAMSSVQRLEELECKRTMVNFSSFAAEMREALGVLARGSGSGPGLELVWQEPGLDLGFTGQNLELEPALQDQELGQVVWLDKGVVFNVVENLFVNALRYGQRQVSARISREDGMLTLTVRDDGPGFPQKILDGGAAPFQRGDEKSGDDRRHGEGKEFGGDRRHRNGAGEMPHLGMGLYICLLLCEKHGGTLRLMNTEDGSLAEASFYAGIREVNKISGATLRES